MSGEENKEAGGDAGVRVAREGPGGRRAGRAGGAERGGTAGDQCSRPQFHRFMGQNLLRPSHFPTRESESHSKFTRLTPGRAEREPGRGPASKAGALSAELTLESPLPLAVLGARAAAKHRTHTSGSRARSREELESDLRANLSSVAGSSSHHATLLRPQFPPL